MSVGWESDMHDGHEDLHLVRNGHHGMVCTDRRRIGAGNGFVVAVAKGERLGWYAKVEDAKLAVEDALR